MFIIIVLAGVRSSRQNIHNGQILYSINELWLWFGEETCYHSDYGWGLINLIFLRFWLNLSTISRSYQFQEFRGSVAIRITKVKSSLLPYLSDWLRCASLVQGLLQFNGAFGCAWCIVVNNNTYFASETEFLYG